jgi:hypothetical protein
MNDLFTAPRPPEASEAPLPPRDHNNPPAPLPYDPEVLGACDKRVNDFTDAAGAWLDLERIETEEQALKLTDFVAGSRKLYKHIDEARIEAKRPHDEAGKVVQAAFTPRLLKIEETVKQVLPLQNDWLDRVRKAEEERRRLQAEAARKLQEEAEALRAQAAGRNDISGQVDAEAMQKQADKLAASAAAPVKVSAGSATGAGRTIAQVETRTAKIINMNVLFMHFREATEVAEVLQRLANAALRVKGWDGKDIPGTETVITRSAR